MKRALAVLLVASVAAGASADRVWTSMWWRGWRVCSSENLWAKKIVVSYPLTNLFDNDKNTAWAYRNRNQSKETLGSEYPYQLVIEFPHKIAVDGIRIMNGYNKDEKTFQANNRVTGIGVFETIWSDSKSRGSFRLPDAMGWHTVRFPAWRTKSLVIHLTRFARPTDVDICLSGLQVVSHGKGIVPAPPRAVCYTPGSD